MASGGAAIRAGRAYVELYADDSKLVRGLRRAQAKLAAFGATLDRIGRRSFGTGLGAGIATAFAIKGFTDFQDELLKIRAFAPATEAEVAMLRKQMEGLSLTSGFSATEIAKAAVELAKAGFNAAMVGQGLGPILQLARATGTELAVATDVASGAMFGFGLQATDMTRIVDTLTWTANASKTSVDALRDTFKYLAPSARLAGFSMEESAAAAATLAQSQIIGSEAGTAIARMMSAMSDTGKRQILEGVLGKSVADAEGNFRPLIDIMGELAAKTAGMGKVEKLGLFTEIFGERGKRAAGVLTENIGMFRQFGDEVTKSAGITASGAALLESGLGGALRRLKANLLLVRNAFVEAFGPSIEALEPRLRKIMDTITEWIQKHEFLVTIMVAAIPVALVLGAAMIFVGQAIMGLAAILGVVASIVPALVAGFTFLISPIGLITAGIVLATAAWLLFTESGQNTLSAIKTTIGGIVAALMAGDIAAAAQIAMLGLKLAFAEATYGIRNLWDQMVTGLRKAFLRFAAQIVVEFEFIVQKMQEALEFLLSPLGISLGAPVDFSAVIEPLREGRNVLDQEMQSRMAQRRANIDRMRAEMQALRSQFETTGQDVAAGVTGQGGPFEDPALLAAQQKEYLDAERAARAAQMGEDVAAPADIESAFVGDVMGAFSSAAAQRLSGETITPLAAVRDAIKDGNKKLEDIDEGVGDLLGALQNGGLTWTGALA